MIIFKVWVEAFIIIMKFEILFRISDLVINIKIKQDYKSQPGPTFGIS